MNDGPRNIAASIHARLAREARKTKRPFAEVLRYYGIERFLYRLSMTQYRDRFILKGGLVLYSWELPLRRPTQDIDFLSTLEFQKETVTQAITAAILLSAPEDGVRFDPASLLVEEAQLVDANRAGMRARLVGYLGKTKLPIHIDFGFSDEIATEAQQITFPTLLPGMSAPQLLGYPAESLIAEKFHAMERFSGLPSRWKDYYDVWLVSRHFEFDDHALGEAIAATFKNRLTPIPASRPVCLAPEFAQEHQQQWAAFLKKSDLENAEVGELAALIDHLWNFMQRPLERLRSPAGPRRRRRWNPRAHKWT